MAKGEDVGREAEFRASALGGKRCGLKVKSLLADARWCGYAGQVVLVITK